MQSPRRSRIDRCSGFARPARAGGPFACAAIAAALLAGCAGTPRSPTASAEATPQAPSTWPATDGPPANPPPDVALTPDAEPRIEPLRSGGPNKPYEVLGQRYTPQLADEPFEQAGLASWYGRRFHGRRTASGEVYDMFAMTAAHRTWPIPSYALVRNPRNGREVVVRINDRGPFKDDWIVDLSYAAAVKLGVERGVAPVQMRRLTQDEIRTGRWRDSTTVVAGRNRPAAPPEADPRPASVPSPAPGAAAARAATAATAAPVAPVAPVATVATVGTAATAATAATIGTASTAATTAPATAFVPAPPPATAPPTAAIAPAPPATASTVATTTAAGPALVPADAAGGNPAPADTAAVAARTDAADPPTSPEADSRDVAASNAPDHRSGFWLQFGAFSRREGALDLKQQLVRDLDWLAHALTVFDERSLWRVQAGPYASHAEALGAARRVRAASAGVQPLILQRR